MITINCIKKQSFKYKSMLNSFFILHENKFLLLNFVFSRSTINILTKPNFISYKYIINCTN